MELQINNSEIKLKLVSDKELEFEQVFMAYQLITGRRDTLETDPEESTNLLDGAHHQSAESTTPIQRETIPKFVKVDLQCPFCGHTSVEQTKYGYRFIKCPECKELIFLNSATATFGIPDERGFYYTATKPFHRKDDVFSELFARNSDPDKPDTYNTIGEIKAYLDAKGIKHDGVTLKGKLLELIKGGGQDEN